MSETIRQATDALNAGNFGTALELAQQALREDPRSYDAEVLQGISLSQMGRSGEATDAFRRAIAIDPVNPKALYNFATHLYQTGQKQEAMAYARQALNQDPNHASAQQLINLIQSEQAPPPVAPAAPGMPYGVQEGSQQQYADYYRQAPSYHQAADGTIHTIPWVGKNQTIWTITGWILGPLAFVIFLVTLSTMGPLITEMFESVSRGQDPDQFAQQMQGAVPGWVSTLSYAIAAATFAWVITDIIDRRGNFLWLLLLVPCTCCGLQFLALPIYMLAGRR